MDWQKQAREMMFGSVTPDFFAINREKIAQSNRRMLHMATSASALVTGALFAASFWIDELRIATPLYFIVCVLSVIGSMAALVVLPSHPGAVRGLLYAYVALYDAAVLILDTVYSPEIPATIYFLVVILSAMIILDKPVKTLLIVIPANVVMCIVSALTKTSLVAVKADFVNAIAATAIGIVFCTYFVNTRLQNLSVVQELLSHNERDPLTGLANKAAIDQRCRSYLGPGRPTGCAMLLLDVDDFKQINAVMGHDAGDEALHNVALTLRTMFRENDIIGRFGGDEFLILMKNISNPADVQEKARRLSGRLADIVTGGRPLQCSMGIAISEEGESTPFEELFAHADMALYSSKANGKNTITIFRAEPELPTPDPVAE